MYWQTEEKNSNSYLKERKPPPQQNRKKIKMQKAMQAWHIWDFDDENHYPQLSVMKAENVHWKEK